MSFSSIKKIVRTAITASPILLSLGEKVGGDYPRIFVYHRFSQPGIEIPHRVSQDIFAWQLDQLQQRFNVMTLADCIDYLLQNRHWPARTVILTIDDGYADFYHYAFPELRKRNMGATFFVTVNFVEGEIWLWPDRIEYAVNASTQQAFSCRIGSETVDFPLHDDSLKAQAIFRLTDYCKQVSDDERQEFLKRLEDSLNISIPSLPVADYQAVTWDQLCELQASGIEIGAHTMTHPILSRLSVDRLEEEILQPAVVLQQQLQRKIDSFCYPNSAEGDINDQVLAIMQESAYSSAVFGTNLRRWDLYRLPRMGLSNERKDFLWKLSGLENFSIKRTTLPWQVAE